MIDYFAQKVGNKKNSSDFNMLFENLIY